MQTFLTVLLVLAAIGAVVALIRGIVIFLRTTAADLNGPDGVNVSGVRQNKMMRMRILFQALAVIFAVLLLLLKRAS
ncbi:HIG1 domain-containing protein [Flavisphingomonas formosensis]|uniref:HIG1 domain-containing protein n=1 Tax=Flavisphingomonas formosensis TaxID=861534 RepID=UPI0012F7A0DD|nr:HIG1 domain-containing protein [Sphingomonas formosensis]